MSVTIEIPLLSIEETKALPVRGAGRSAEVEEKGLTDLEELVLSAVEKHIDALKAGQGIILPVTHEWTDAKAVTGPMYGVNKVLVTLGRITGIGLKARPLPRDVARSKAGVKTAMVIRYYGRFDNMRYATEQKNPNTTAYEEPSDHQLGRVSRWVAEHGFKPTVTEPKVEFVDKRDE